jgi:urease
MGEANASIPTVQPVYGRPMWAAQPSAAGLTSIVWSSKAAIDNGMLAIRKDQYVRAGEY